MMRGEVGEASYQLIKDIQAVTDVKKLTAES